MRADLNKLIQSNPDSRELKRAVAVQMYLQGQRHRQIQEVLGVSSGFISTWTRRYKLLGASGLRLGYPGSMGYLSTEEHQSVVGWLKTKNYWNLTELQTYLETEYEVVFESKQSYYDLFAEAGISAEIDSEAEPQKRPRSGQKKRNQISDWLEAHRPEIVAGSLVVFFEDECYLLWGDLCGYVWGKTTERIEVPIVNERSKQTYYGAVNLLTQQCLVQAYESGNSESTIAFLKYLLSQCPNSRIAVLWDGASYHRSIEVRAYLASVNQGLQESERKLTCIRFAPNAPEQNPIEDIWLCAKRFIRECYHLCKSFAAVKYLFEFVTHRQIFDFPKLFTYGHFSQLI